MLESYDGYCKPSIRRGWLLIVLVGLLLIVAAVTVDNRVAKRWIFNITPSLPKGLYRLHYDHQSQTIAVGDIAVFPIPKTVVKIAAERRYLDPTFPLMKPVSAAFGDEVCTKGREVIVNGQSFGRIRRADSAGRPLPFFEFCGSVQAGEIFTFTNDERSFDSRHYGPVPTAEIIARATPLWTS